MLSFALFFEPPQVAQTREGIDERSFFELLRHRSDLVLELAFMAQITDDVDAANGRSLADDRRGDPHDAMCWRARDIQRHGFDVRLHHCVIDEFRS
jgi:hypothetical protein